MWVLLALPFFPEPACQPRQFQGRVWMTSSRATKGVDAHLHPGLFQRRMNTCGSGCATPVEWTMIPLGTIFPPGLVTVILCQELLTQLQFHGSLLCPYKGCSILCRLLFY